MFIKSRNSCFSQQFGIIHLWVAEVWKTGSTQVNFLLVMTALSHLHGMVQPWRYEAKVQNTDTNSEDFISCPALHYIFSYSSVVHKRIWVTTYISLLPACIQFNTNTNRLMRSYEERGTRDVMLKRKIWQEMLELLLSLTRQCLPLSSINQFLGLLPWEDVTTKMTIRACLLVDRVTQIKLPGRKKKKKLGS